ncbi:MAG TPA: YbaN family protein [Pseudoduganella sp.]
MRAAFVIAGFISLALGIIGIFVPLLPTTPFLLLASACFARGSKRMHHWLRSHGTFGRYLRDFEDGRGIPLRGKVLAMAMMWPSMIYAMWRVGHLALQLMLLAIACGVTFYILRLPTSR